MDISKATPPTMVSVTVDDNVAVQYTPAVFNMSFNKKMATYHTLALVSIDGKETNYTLSTKNDGSTLTLNGKSLSNLLKGRGYVTGDMVLLEIVVRGSIQDPSRGITNGFVDSHEKYGFSWAMPDDTVPGNPWEDFTETSSWGMIGSIASTGNNWNADGPMYSTPDGTRHVARNVKLAPGDQFKVRKDGGWDTNFGAPGDTEPYVMTVGEAIEATPGGKNLGVAADGNYDLLLDEEAGTLTLFSAYETYPGFDEVSTWSVIGNIASVPMEWNKDIQMTTDGEWHVAEGVVLTTADQFKFRKDLAWTDNFGAAGDTEPFVVELDMEYDAVGGGKNLAVPADGTYDLLVNPGAQLYKVVESLGGKSPLVGGDTPEPPAPAVTGWNIIGLNGDWDNDVIATQDGNVWTAYVTAAEPTEFKWRKDGAWDADFGGVFVNLGEPFEAVAGGPNIQIPAGFWKVVLNLDDNTITVSNGQVWGLIGVNGDWDHDIDMTLSDGKWVSPVTKIAGEFKIRENHAWSNDRGGVFTAVGQAFEAVAGGPNISVEEGNYVVTYDPAAETIVIDETGWGLVGTINDWGNGGPDVILKEDGNFLVAKNVALTENDEIKLRYNSDWDVNRGGRTAVGHGVKVENNGANIKPGVAGNYDIWFRPESDVLFVMEAGSDLLYWGLVGTINNWGNDGADLILYETEDGKFVFDELTVTGSDELKIRQNEDWGVNRGGAFAELGEPFAVENNGANIKVGRDAKFSVTYDPAEETVTLNGEYTGEAPSLPETMYIIGEAIGGWEWTGDYIVDMTPVNGQAGQFWAIRYLEAGKPFKFCAVKEWSGDFTGLGEDSGYTVADNNCSVAENGVYMIYVDVANKKLCIEPAKVYGIGTCFGDWNEGMETALFTAADGKLTATVANAGELRMYAASSIATSDWWTREFIILDGKIAYRGNGGDQERVSVAAGAKVTLDFNAGIGTIE